MTAAPGLQGACQAVGAEELSANQTSALSPGVPGRGLLSGKILLMEAECRQASSASHQLWTFPDRCFSQGSTRPRGHDCLNA